MLSFKLKSLILALGVLSLFLFSAVHLNSMNIYAEEKTVIIPKGAGDPSLDPSVKDRPSEWYIPSTLRVQQGDTVTWINNEETENHVVTSGEGITRLELTLGKLGEADGLFDSGLFAPREQWSYTFNEPGIYNYFCTVHPWMVGTVIVEPKIPDYPHDAQGNEVQLPLIYKTKDRQYTIGLYWSPLVLKTGGQALFTVDFFDTAGTIKQNYVTYDFVLIQNGKEVYRSTSFSELGSDTRYFVFSEPGPVTIRIENIADTDNYAEFSAIVYKGESETSVNAVISGSRDPWFIQVITILSIGVIGGGVIFTIMIYKGVGIKRLMKR